MTTLETISGIQARIFNLPNRPPFMIAADLAEVYGTTVKRLNQAVMRNQDRFPEDFMFRLTEVEEQQRWSQNVTTSPGKRTDLRPLVFTHAGAYALSAVLKTPVAAEVSVVIHRAFAAMEARALADVRVLLQKVQSDARNRKPVRARIVDAMRDGWDFDTLKGTVSMSQPKLAQAVKDCLGLGLIEAAPAGTPFGLIKASASVKDDRQPGLFPDV